MPSLCFACLKSVHRTRVDRFRKGIKSKKKVSYLNMVVAAIKEGKDPKGSSLAHIKKYIQANYDADNANALRKALKDGIKKGALEQGDSSQRFRVKGVQFATVDDGFRQEDVKVGSGDAAEDGATVVVSYKGTLEDGHCFDQAKTFEFTLGAGEVIKGWDRGVKGMRVGGKRTLVCPSKFGYGARGSPPDIPGGATLLFTVELKKIK